jgi:hypothetical protein
MHTPTIPGRGLAIVVGLGFLVASLSTLLGDDLLNYRAWTMQHYEVVAILLGATGFGILCRLAKRGRRWLACGAFGFLFIACTCLVVYKSLGRQAAATAMQTMTAEDSNKLIADKMADLTTTRQRLLDAEAAADHERKGRPDRHGRPTTKAGCGDRCKDWERRAAEVRSRIQVLEQEMRALGPRQVASPHAENFAQLLGVLGAPIAKVKVLAILFVPVVWTMVLEIGTIAGLEYGFSGGKHRRHALADSRQTSFAGDDLREAQRTLAAELPDIDPPPRGSRKVKRLPATQLPRRLPANVIPISGNRHPVISALERAGKPLSNQQLAAAMGVSPGESSKRWPEIVALLDVERHGKCLQIGLKAWRQAMA